MTGVALSTWNRETVRAVWDRRTRRGGWHSNRRLRRQHSVGRVLPLISQTLVLLGNDQQLTARRAIAEQICDSSAFLGFEPEEIGMGGHDAVTHSRILVRRECARPLQSLGEIVSLSRQRPVSPLLTMEAL